jgi:hypothetical protein
LLLFSNSHFERSTQTFPVSSSPGYDPATSAAESGAASRRVSREKRPLADVFARTSRAAAEAGLTDAEIDTELAVYKAERRT